MKTFIQYCMMLIALAIPFIGAAAEVIKVEQAWARTTVPGQEVSAAYLTLKSTTDTTLTGLTSPNVGSIEMHTMSMNNGAMEMRKLDQLRLPAGKTVKLEPGGHHLMLFDLKKPLKAGDQLELVLKLKDKSGKPKTQLVQVPVKLAD